jgi:pimeloyl-ACP methyl ester carboxylesterase
MRSLLKTVWNDHQLEVSKLPDMRAFASSRECHLPSGARYFCYWPKKRLRGWLLSLHGGPESYEGREVRYCGLYQALLEKGIGIVVLNYRGSTQKGRFFGSSSEVWGRWSDAIVEDAFELFSKLPQKVLKEPMLILGGSFGGSLAMILAQTIGADGLVLFSPLLDLKEQIRRAGMFYARWFQDRFSTRDLFQIRWQGLSTQIDCPVYMAFSSRDEVLGARTHHLLWKKMKRNSNWSFLEQSCPHAPQAYRDCKKRYLSAFEFICRAVNRVSKSH